MKITVFCARLALLVPALLNACNMFNTEFEDVEDAQMYVARELKDAPDTVSEILVMNWNVKFGGARIDFFFDCYGDRVLMTKSEVFSNLEGLAAKINQVDPDLLLIQEVDIDSKRSAFIDMMQWLLDHTNLNYGAYASQWRADYVASDGVGRVDSGNGILSRWPLRNAQRFALPLVSDYDALTQKFYLKRNVLKTQVAIPGYDDLFALNVHTEAYSTDGTKKEQIDIFKSMLDEIALDGRLFIGGGDLNTLPPGSDQVEGFTDSVCSGMFDADSYAEETDWLDAFYSDYTPEIPLAEYQANDPAYYTHTVNGQGFWTRKLDYLFTDGTYVPGSGLTHQDESTGMATMPLSDHCPVTVRLEMQ